jgi:hypothetical protein
MNSSRKVFCRRHLRSRIDFTSLPRHSARRLFPRNPLSIRSRSSAATAERPTPEPRSFSAHLLGSLVAIASSSRLIPSISRSRHRLRSTNRRCAMRTQNPTSSRIVAPFCRASISVATASWTRSSIQAPPPPSRLRIAEHRSPHVSPPTSWLMFHPTAGSERRSDTPCPVWTCQDAGYPWFQQPPRDLATRSPDPSRQAPPAEPDGTRNPCELCPRPDWIHLIDGRRCSAGSLGLAPTVDQRWINGESRRSSSATRQMTPFALPFRKYLGCVSAARQPTRRGAGQYLRRTRDTSPPPCYM